MVENLAELTRNAGRRVVVREIEADAEEAATDAEAKCNFAVPDEQRERYNFAVPGVTVEEEAKWNFAVPTKYNYALPAAVTMTIIDAGGGGGPEAVAAALGCEWCVLVTHDADGALADTYATAKMLLQGGYEGRLGLVMNNCRDEHRARVAARRFRRTAARFLAREVEELGVIPHDRRMLRAQRLREPLVRLSPRSSASIAVEAVWARLMGASPSRLEASGLWTRMASLFL